MKVVGVVKSIVGTDAVIAIDEDGNQRAIFPGDNLYDNEKLLELSGVQVNVEPVTVADAQKKSEPKSDKEVASLQDALLNGKDISELEETAAGGNAGGGNASSDGVSLGAASFVASGHESSIHADASAISEVAPASVAGLTNVSGGAEEFTNLDKSPYDFTMSIMDNVGEKQGDLMLDDKPITDDNILTFSGTGTPGAKVVLYEDHLTVENNINNWTDSKPFAEVTVGADGRWSYTPDSAFLNTRYGFAGKQIDTVDGQPVTYKLTKGVLVDADIPTAEDMTVHSKLALTDMVIDSDDPGLLYHLTKSPLIDLEERITDFTPTFIGTSEPFANIKIEAKGTYSGDLYSNLDKLVTLYTKADEKGNWKVESDKELGLFDHEVKVSTVSDSGAVLSSLDPIDFMMPTRALHTDPFAAL